MFLYIFVSQTCSFLHDNCTSVCIGRIFLQESVEVAELLCPYLAGHRTAVKGQFFNSLTHLPLYIPKWS